MSESVYTEPALSRIATILGCLLGSAVGLRVGRSPFFIVAIGGLVAGVAAGTLYTIFVAFLTARSPDATQADP